MRKQGRDAEGRRTTKNGERRNEEKRTKEMLNPASSFTARGTNLSLEREKDGSERRGGMADVRGGGGGLSPSPCAHTAVNTLCPY